MQMSELNQLGLPCGAGWWTMIYVWPTFFAGHNCNCFSSRWICLHWFYVVLIRPRIFQTVEHWVFQVVSWMTSKELKALDGNLCLCNRDMESSKTAESRVQTLRGKLRCSAAAPNTWAWALGYFVLIYFKGTWCMKIFFSCHCPPNQLRV